ncbi:MAG: MFS transporter [Acidobacteria bacterium]|nr:MFS transporter [Acidobacteriota bacterium]
MKLFRRMLRARALPPGRDFRRLCVSQVFGGLGEWLATLALIALVWDRTHSALASGVILAFRILPAALVGSFLGALVDRLDRRRVLVVCTAGRACVYGALPLVGGVAPVLGLALVAEIASIAYIAARDATLPRMVPAGSLPAANAISMGSGYGAMPLGSGLFALITWLGGRRAVSLSLFAAAAMLGVATLLIGRVRASACASHPTSEEGSAERDPRSGRAALRALFREDPVLRRLALGAGIAATGGGAIITLGLSYVRETLHAGPGAYSGLLTTFCLGAVAGVVTVQRARRHLPRLFNIGVGAMGAILLGMALYPSTAMGYGMGFAFGGAFVSTFLGGITILQDRVHDSVRGRAFAIAHSGLRVGAVAMGILAAWGAKSLGSGPHVVAGLSLDGTQLVLAAAGILLAAGGTLLLRPAVRAARA